MVEGLFEYACVFKARRRAREADWTSLLMKGLFKRGPGVRIPPPPPVLPRKHARVSGAVTKFALFAPKTRHTLASLRGFVVSLLVSSTIAQPSPNKDPDCIQS